MRVLVLALTLIAPTSLVGQSSPARTFDAVSIREAPAGTGGGMRLLPNGDIRVDRLPAKALIAIAHELDAYRVVNAPDWTNQVSYDVVAKANADTRRPQIFEMMRAMLVERFKLTTHRETRNLDGFALVRTSATSLGPGLTTSPVNCEENPRDTHCRVGGITSNRVEARGIPIANLAWLASGLMGAPIVDQTGLTGVFDIDLRWSTDASTDDAPVLPTALQEQLGLKLQRERVPTDVLVIDHVERATAN